MMRNSPELHELKNNGAVADLSSSSAEVSEAGPERSTWGGKLEFILTCVGYAVGLGNIWRFPYLAYQNGGGAFILPYVLMLALVGLPLFYMETNIGQFASVGPITAWRMMPILKGLGYASIIVSSMIGIYYNVINSWIFYYFFASMTDKLPWTSCGNSWNTAQCFTGRYNKSIHENQTLTTPAEEFFYRRVLQMSDGLETPGTLVWQLGLTLLISWILVFLVLIKGIKSLGKVSYFVSLFPYVLLTVLLIQGAMLDGAAEGIRYYIVPEWERLASLTVWSDAASQIFYSLGLCMGGILAMASFSDFKNNTLRDALIIPFVNCGTSLYAGFVIFAVLGFMAKQRGVDIKDVATEGPGLIFVVYPEGIGQMPIAPLWAVLFFFMMLTLGFSSQFSIIEGVVAALVDEIPVLGKGMRPTIMRALMCLLSFLIGLSMVTQGGYFVFSLVNDYSGGYPLLIIGLLELFTISWIYGFDKFAEDISMMTGRKISVFWRITWCFVSPAIALIILITKIVGQKEVSVGKYIYPWSGTLIAVCIVLMPMMAIIICALYKFCRNGGWRVLKESFRSSPEWGPASPEYRTGRYAPKKALDSFSL